VGARRGDAGELVCPAVVVFTRDTVFGAMGVVQQHRLGRVAVVRDRDGAQVGDVTVEELCRAWGIDPLMTLAQWLARRSGLRLMAGLAS